MTKRFRPCGNPACSICRYNLEGVPPDSGHPVEDRARDLIAGAIAIGLAFLLLFFLLPAMAAP
jgi:hypothetical protein